jgi:hypothetical protein
MLTERFHRLRRQELTEVFSKQNITKIWRSVVKDQLRKVDILDIYDYYDFNYHIDSRALLIRNNIINGTYEASKPLIYKIEKKLGVCRHLVIPQPVDALVLQIITEKISPEILENQPSKNAFYSRDKHNLRKPYEIEEYGQNWKVLWKKMQKQIYKFNDEKELIAVTDLSNYYDSIFIPELRKIITGYVKNNEVLLDMLFKILESISWIPDYLPYVGRGLPTTNLEGIRLLAHSFLFELDNILKETSNDNFIRWMDDITIGVDTKVEAIEILSSSSDVLKSRGLALNLSKTNIYSSKDAEFHFLIDENAYLDNIDFDKYLENGINKITNELNTRFNRHLKNNRNAKYFEKISKRYITAFSKLNSKKILNKVPKLFSENPGIRQNLLYYLSSLGYNERTSEIVLKVLDELKLYDDISLFNICKLITEWNIPTNENGINFIKKIDSIITIFSSKRKNPFDFYCLLWIKSKYSHPEDLFVFIGRYENLWKSHPFLRRQVTSIMARLLLYKEDSIRKELSMQIATAEPQVVSVATSILYFKDSTSIEGKVKMYLFPKSKQETYSLQKFLVLCSFLNSETYRTDADIQNKVREYITDHHYKKWIELQFNIK